MTVKLLFPDYKSRAFTLSYDDAPRQDLELLPIVNFYGMKATFNFNSGLSGTAKMRGIHDCSILDIPANIRAYRGHEIASHTYDHPHLEDIPMAAQYETYKRDIETLARWTGRPILGSAYPYGTYSDQTLQVLKDLGIKYARTVRSTYAFHRPYNFLLWHPTVHHRDPRLLEVLRAFLDTGEELPCFFLWGHAYEFALDGSYKPLTDVGDMLKERDDVWYATNYEIYRYYCDSDLLLYKNGRIRNYARRNLYLEVDGRKICIGPRQTVETEEHL